MTAIDPDVLLPNDRTKRGVASGEITQLTRGQAYAETGDTFEVEGDRFVVTAVDELTLGEFTDADARREGSADLEAYKERMIRVHGGTFEWDDESSVVRHRFEAE